ncbi:hypothetical protein [Paenibacillus humicus]|uniref:hypothetical protein n=1 Tax=Paenibacillus humicus TaxID=412861 RepID=UPI003D2C3A77
MAMGLQHWVMQGIGSHSVQAHNAKKPRSFSLQAGEERGVLPSQNSPSPAAARLSHQLLQLV